jgi:hypothetical protein
VTPQLAVDAERLAVNWCRNVPEITAYFGDRIYTELPKSPVWPVLRIVRVAGAPTSRLARLDNPLLQIDVWGGPKVTARDGIATVLAHMAAELVGSHAEGAVTAVEVGSLSWRPDDFFTPARPRYQADVALWTHPGAPAGS